MHLLVLSFFVVLVGCGPGGIHTRPPVQDTDDTTLGPGDEFEVRVHGEEDLTDEYRVGRDGSIDFPYLGKVVVRDLEPFQAADVLENRLREAGILVTPQVSLHVTAYNSKRVTISGAVRSPGNFPITPGLTAVQAINLAGGTTELANRDQTIIRRRVEGRLRRYVVPVDAITRGDEEEFPIRAGDVVFVPERPF